MKDKLWYQLGAIDSYIFPDFTSEKYSELYYLDKIELCQIPENLLKEMSTEALIETCLNYPFFADMIFRDSAYSGFQDTLKNFNGLQELINCKDVGEKIYEFYKNINLDEVIKLEDMFTIRLRYLDYIFSQ